MLPLILLSLLIAICGSDNGIIRSKSASSACYDKDPDCSSDICRNYPYTAKERCPKFCGLCYDSLSGSTDHSSSGISLLHRQSSTLKDGAVEKERKPLVSCDDKNSDCTAEICRNYPFTAKERCAKTCGLCSDDIIGSGSTTSEHHSTAIGTGVLNIGGGAASPSLSPRRGNALISGSLCFDRKFDCDREICRDFPFTAREECAKTCGFCSVDSSISSPSSDTTLRSMSPSVQIDGRSGGTSHRPAKHESYEATQNIPAYSRLSRGEELECVDLNNDCTQQTCKNYPLTARERCAKTCGFCRRSVGDRYSSLPATRRGTSESDRSDSSSQRNKGSPITKDCKDEDSQCSERSCLEHPLKAYRKCAKTCGFCGEKSSHGSIISLESPTAVSSDESSVITLDSDDSDSSSTQSAITSERHFTSGSGDGRRSEMQKPKHSSIGSRTDSSRSSSSAHIQQPTNKPRLGIQRYPGRTGPCVDENKLCEKADCYKYPNFSQRYCEKTCNYC